MPILEVSMLSEEGMDIRQLQEALRKKASPEMFRINLQPDRIVRWEANPSFSDLSPNGMTLRWHYKQYNKT